MNPEYSNQPFLPGPTPNTVRSADGKVLTAPKGWILLAPGDAALTRRVKAAGDHWVVQDKRGRKTFSKGVWAPAVTIDRLRVELEAERSTEQFAKRKESAAQRREKVQAEYVDDFLGAVVTFLAFHPNHTELANRLARAVSDHATPVGSGTVARTKRIPVEQRAEAALSLRGCGTKQRPTIRCQSRGSKASAERFGECWHNAPKSCCRAIVVEIRLLKRAR